VLVALCVAGAAATSSGAAVTIDAHDRAAVARLVTTFQRLRAETKGFEGIADELGRCPAVKALHEKDEDFDLLLTLYHEFANRFMVDVAHTYRRQFHELASTFDAAHPHAAPFKRWLAVQQRTITLLLRLEHLPMRPVKTCSAAAQIVTLLRREKPPDRAGLDAALRMSAAERSAAAQVVARSGGNASDTALRAWLRAAGYDTKTIQLLAS
jgi:hypothetical protein